jgi:Tol biopolymer transport system component
MNPTLTQKVRVVLSTVVAAVALTSVPIVAQSPQQLFQQALSRERGQGALEEALALYQRVVREAGADRALAARALLQQAGIYEKLGRVEARATYERIVREFGDQKDAVASAQTRLAAIAGADKPGTARAPAPAHATVSEAPLFGSGIVSPDGEWIAIAGGPNRAARWLSGYRTLYLRHVRTGETRDIDTPTAPDALVSGALAWSPDSTRVVFNSCAQPPVTCELVATDLRGERQVVLPRQRGFFRPLAWAPDGRTIAVLFNGNPAHVSVVNVSDGAIRELLKLKNLSEGGRDEFRWFERPGDVAFSLDGAHLTFTSGGWNQPQDISVLPVDGGDIRPLVAHPADDRFMAWTPAGNLLFLSNRSGAYDLWMARVVDGRTSGLPVVLRRNIGLVQTHGLSERGALYYLSPGPRRMPGGGIDFSLITNDVYLAEIDPDSGRVLQPPVAIAPDPPGRTHSPSWSADGRWLVYRTRDDATFVWSSFMILSTETGEARAVRPTGIDNIAQQPAWLTPDGRALIAVGLVPDGGRRERQLYRVDLETGATSTPIGGPVPQNAELSADGRFVVALRTAAPNQNITAAIIVRDLATGEDRVVYEAAPKVQANGNALSADGTHVAFREVAGANTRLLVLSLADGRTREVATLPGAFAGGQKEAWSPDGRFLYFVQQPNRSAAAEELWRVPSQGGTPQKVLSSRTAIWNPRIDPTGRYLAFASQTEGWNAHLDKEPPADASPDERARQWGRELVLEHFLRESELRRPPVR